MIGHMIYRNHPAKTSPWFTKCRLLKRVYYSLRPIIDALELIENNAESKRLNTQSRGILVKEKKVYWEKRGALRVRMSSILWQNLNVIKSSILGQRKYVTFTKLWAHATLLQQDCEQHNNSVTRMYTLLALKGQKIPAEKGNAARTF